MEEEIKQTAILEEAGGISPSDAIDKKDSALIKSIKDKGAHSVMIIIP